MSKIVCPHCQSTEFASVNKIPKGVVAVIPCPECSELVVRFKNKAIALDKDVLYNGTKDERKMHLADVIAEFLDEGILNLEMLQSPNFDQLEVDEDSEPTEDQEADDLQPISDEELKRFTDFDLDRLDNIDYFRKNFE